jgi:alkyl hydroperoxide reductase subunit AhpC
VCTTELSAVAKLKDEWAKRNTVVVALAVDSRVKNTAWIDDINALGGAPVDFPIICDEDYKVAKLYSMVNQDHIIDGMPVTARSVFFIGPDKKVKATLTYPAPTGRNFDELLRVLDALQLTVKYSVATPANWTHGEKVVVLPTIPTEEAEKLFPKGIDAFRPYLRFTPDPSV